MARQLSHEGLAKTHDFGVAAAVGVKVATTLTAADTLIGQGVLEDLLKTQELDDACVN